jgi:hypothetical protein
MPVAASMTTRSGCTASTSMKEPWVMPEKVRRRARFSLASEPPAPDYLLGSPERSPPGGFEVSKRISRWSSSTGR